MSFSGWSKQLSPELQERIKEALEKVPDYLRDKETPMQQCAYAIRELPPADRMPCILLVFPFFSDHHRNSIYLGIMIDSLAEDQRMQCLHQLDPTILKKLFNRDLAIFDFIRNGAQLKDEDYLVFFELLGKDKILELFQDSFLDLLAILPTKDRLELIKFLFRDYLPATDIQAFDAATNQAHRVTALKQLILKIPLKTSRGTLYSLTEEDTLISQLLPEFLREKKPIVSATAPRVAPTAPTLTDSASAPTISSPAHSFQQSKIPDPLFDEKIREITQLLTELMDEKTTLQGEKKQKVPFFSSIISTSKNDELFIKQQKISALTDLSKSSNLAELKRRAEKYRFNEFINSGSKSHRVRDLIQSIFPSKTPSKKK